MTLNHHQTFVYVGLAGEGNNLGRGVTESNVSDRNWSTTIVTNVLLHRLRPLLFEPRLWRFLEYKPATCSPV